MNLTFIGISLLAATCALGAPGKAPAGMVLIPPGEYLPLFAPETAAKPSEIPAFYLDTRPVTNAEFLAFVRANPSWRRSAVVPILADNGYLKTWAKDLDPGPSVRADAPVVNVSWFAARAYADWNGKRLPTTAEWERVAQAGFTSENGAAEQRYRQLVLAWFSKPAPADLLAAGSNPPNFFGVYDLVGLVWEWVDDFSAAMVGTGADGDGGAQFCGGAAAAARKFTDYPAFLRAGFRSSLKASYVMANLGFRCALSP